MDIEKLSKRVNEKLKLDLKLVEEVCRSPFKFILEQTQESREKAINIIYLGKITPNKRYKTQKKDNGSGSDIFRNQEPNIQE